MCGGRHIQSKVTISGFIWVTSGKNWRQTLPNLSTCLLRVAWDTDCSLMHGSEMATRSREIGDPFMFG